MNEIKIFNYENKKLRTQIINEEIWFVGKDVAEILGYSNPSKAVIAHVDKDDKEILLLEAHSQNGNLVKTKTILINESGLYSLILSSKLPKAKSFKRWVTNEVLPSIRKHGAYMTPETLEKVMLTPDFIIKLAEALKEEQEKNKELREEIEIKQQLIEELKPIKEYVDVILSSNKSLTVTQIAADYSMSAKKLNNILHEQRIQRKVNDQWILYVDYMNKGYTKSETFEINGKAIINTRWTQKGRLKIHEILTALGYKANMDLKYE